MQRPSKPILLFLLLLQFAACRDRGTNPTTISQMTKGTVDNNGVDIHYTDSKAGETVLFFVHGWGIDHTYWDSQTSYFSKAYRVVTIDLPGFGTSGRNRTSWTVEAYARDIKAVMEALELKKVILIGHSMSGSIVVEAARAHPSGIIGLVGVDNMKAIGFAMTPEMEREWDTHYATMEKHFERSVAEEGKFLFSPTTDPAVQKRVLRDISSADPAIAVASLKNLDKYPFAQKLQSLEQPLYLINSDYQPTDTLAFKQNHIDYHLLNMGTTGHYPMIENSKRFNALLEKAIGSIMEKGAR
ncbi:alpha/beta fold hydrolase [Flagellimonas hadalis]|nr:alpha/beta hydrolase [Allomuricauda hadalis]